MIQLDQDEHIVYVARKHWFFFVAETASIFILIIAPFVAIFVLLEQEFFLVFLYASMLWTAVFLVVLAYIWTDYYLDVWVVTNKRLIDVDQNGLFRRKISSSRIDLIQDLTVEIPGIIATISGYGDIHMQTAGQSREFVFKNVSRPENLKDIILKEHNRFRDEMISTSFH